MTFRTYRHKGFKFRPRALRRAVLLILERRASLTTAEIASCAYFHGGPVARPGWRTPNEAEMQATYRAVRRLVAKGARSCTSAELVARAGGLSINFTRWRKPG